MLPQLTSSSLGLTPVLGTASDLGDMFAGVMTGHEELRRDMTKRLDQVEKRAQQSQEKLRDELTDVKSQARTGQAQLIQNTDQCLAESLALAAKESEERDIRMTREIDQLLNDNVNTYAHAMNCYEKRLDAKSDLMMRKLDEILSDSNRKKRPGPREDSGQATDEDGARSYVGAQLRSRTNLESNHRERHRAVPSRPGWTNLVPLEADAISGTRLPTMPQVRSKPGLTTALQDTTMYASIFEPLNRSLETFITKLSKSRRTLKKRNRTRTSQMAASILG